MNLDFINNFKCSKDNLTLWVRLAASHLRVTSRTIWLSLYQGQISRQDSLQSLVSLSLARGPPMLPLQLDLRPHKRAWAVININKWSLTRLLIMVRSIRISTDQAREALAALMSITCRRTSIQVPSCTCMALLLTTTTLRHTCLQPRAAWALIVAIELQLTSPTCLLLYMKDVNRRTIIHLPCLSDTGLKVLLLRIVRRKRILMMIGTIMWK